MEEVVLVIHLILALAIIALVLLQRSEGGGLGIGSGGGMGALATAHTTANILSRATAICATGFFITSMTLGILGGHHARSTSLLDDTDKKTVAAAPATLTPPIAGKVTGEQPIGTKPSTDPSAPAPIPDKNVVKAAVPAPAPAQPLQPSAPISK